MQTKPTIVWSGESSAINTGFGVIAKEVLSRLHNTGLFNIVEIASYIKNSDSRTIDTPWRVYGVMPEDHDEEGQKSYNSSPFAQFGEQVLEYVLLEEKADVLIDITDPWMASSWELKSPFIKNVNYVYHPTIDGCPLKNEWIEDYAKADLLLSYSQFGKDSVEKQTNGGISVLDVTRPGVNHDIFKPLDKKKIREKYGIDKNAKVILTVMRNQRRKLYPDLIDAFGEFLELCKTKGDLELYDNSYLYLHTALNDVGWDIGKYIVQSGLVNKILITYKCLSCGKQHPQIYQGSVCMCPNCGQYALTSTNTQTGSNREELCEIYNLADLYVQYSISEGLGMPVAEAKSCGTPSIGVDYSATAEQVNVYGCSPIRVEKFFYETVMETEQKRALPDNTHAAELMYEYLTLPQEEWLKLSEACRTDASQNYSFDRAAKIIKDAVLSLSLKDHAETWDNPNPNWCKISRPDRPFTSSSEFVDWCFTEVWNRPDFLGSHWRNYLVASINNQFIVDRFGHRRFTEQECYEMFVGYAQKHNYWESKRLEKLGVMTNTNQWVRA